MCPDCPHRISDHTEKSGCLAPAGPTGAPKPLHEVSTEHTVEMCPCDKRPSELK